MTAGQYSALTERRYRRALMSRLCFSSRLALLSKTQVVFLPVVLLLCAWWRDKERWNAPRSASRDAGRPTKLPARRHAVLAIFPDRDRFGPGHDVVSKPRHRRRRDRYRLATSPLRERRNGDVVVRWTSLRPCPINGDLPKLAIRFSRSFGMAAFDRAYRRFGWSLALAEPWDTRRFFCGCLFYCRTPPSAGTCSNGLRAQRHARRRSSPVFCRRSFDRAFQRGRRVRVEPATAAEATAGRQRATQIATATIVTLLVAAMGTYAFVRAEVYRNEETLWPDNLSKNPDAWQAHIMMAQRRFKQERYAEAAYHAGRAAELKPELADIHNELGLAYCRLERFEEGIGEYRKALQLKEANPSTARSAGVAKIRANLANALAITANHLSESAPTVPEEAMRRYDEAIRQYEEALEIDPQQPAIHRNLGMLLAQLGRYDEAIPHLRATLQMVPNEPTARQLLDEIEARRR